MNQPQNEQQTETTEHTPGEVLDLTIERIVPRGLGIGFSQGLTVFVRLAAPGDRLRVRLDDVKKNVAFASIVDILEPSPHRVVPPCEYFDRCGGCDFQQMSYAEQLRSKKDIIADCLRRLAKLEVKDLEIIANPQPFGYRSRAQWHLDRDSRRLGYYRRDSHDVVDVERCPILTDGMSSALEYVRNNTEWEMLLANTVHLDAASDGSHISLYSENLLEPTAELSFQAAGFEYFYSAACFFQADRGLVSQLIELVVGGLTGNSALDLYSGVGLFSLPLGRAFASVIGIEDNSVSVDFAEANAARAGLGNVEFHSTRVSHFLSIYDGKPDAIVLDPPRAGTEKKVIERIAEMRPAVISYVSCEPSILARDLRRLVDRGYWIENITAVDLFPQSHHVETVARLRLGTKD